MKQYCWERGDGDAICRGVIDGTGALAKGVGGRNPCGDGRSLIVEGGSGKVLMMIIISEKTR